MVLAEAERMFLRVFLKNLTTWTFSKSEPPVLVPWRVNFLQPSITSGSGVY